MPIMSINTDRHTVSGPLPDRQIQKQVTLFYMCCNSVYNILKKSSLIGDQSIVAKL